jgi:hypothetical protein
MLRNLFYKRTIWIWLLLISLFCNLWLLTPNSTKPREGDTPSNNPFILSPNLTLKSLINDGYRFLSMPCAQVQYSKTFGDTTIQYEVGMCPADIKLNPSVNPYYPYSPSETGLYCDDIKWSVYSFKIGPIIDSTAIINFVEAHKGTIVEDLSQWNSKDGGILLVLHRPSSIYFRCVVNQEYNYDDTTPNISWEFSLIRTLPKIDI